MNHVAERSRPLRGWGPHVVMGVLLVAQLLVWAVLHRSDEEILDAWRNGDTRSRLDAFHVMTNRGSLDRARFDEPFVRRLLDEPDDRIRELAFTNEVCKFHVPDLQSRYVYDFSGGDTAHTWRANVLHRRKVGGTSVVGGGMRLQRRELQWFLDATHGRPVDAEELQRHLIELINRINERQRLADDP